MNKYVYFLLIFLFAASLCPAQVDELGANLDDDLSSGNDIFTDFQEDLGSKQMQEDERFYRYGRFVSASFGIGITSFTGNRGKAYHDNNPTLAIGLIYFSDFQNAFSIGIEHSKHTMYLDQPTITTGNSHYGAIEITLLRPYIGYRYYLDTADLSSILTYANPYFTGRIEYWYQSRKFKEYDQADSTQNAVGFSGGLGIEIPVDLNKSFIGLQFLLHSVTLPDTETQEYQKNPNCTSDDCYGYSDLKGMGYSIITSYLFSW